MIPMGIERCGFLASSPVQTQDATCAPLHCTARGKYSQGMSQSRDFPWQHRTGKQQAGAVGDERLWPCCCYTGRKDGAAWRPGLADPLAMPALPPHQQLPLPTEPIEWKSSLNVCLGFAKVCCTRLPARSSAAGKEEAAGQPLEAGWHRQGQAEQPVPATH